MTLNEFSKACGFKSKDASHWFIIIKSAMDEFGISDVQDKAMFLAQTGHESNGFNNIVESFNYSPEGLLNTFGNRITKAQAKALGRTEEHKAQQEQIANVVYNGRMNNKPPHDGWRYRGRGLIQITGFNNYNLCGDHLNLDLINKPELLEEHSNAARSSAWFFSWNGCIGLSGDVKKATLIINGGSNGLDDRIMRYEKAIAALM